MRTVFSMSGSFGQVAARQLLSLNCLAIALVAGVILREVLKPSLRGERQFGMHLKRQFGRW